MDFADRIRHLTDTDLNVRIKRLYPMGSYTLLNESEPLKDKMAVVAALKAKHGNVVQVYQTFRMVEDEKSASTNMIPDTPNDTPPYYTVSTVDTGNVDDNERLRLMSIELLRRELEPNASSYSTGNPLKIHAIDYTSVKLTPESECVRFLLEYGATVQTFKFPVASLTEIAIPENTDLYEAIAKVEEPGFRPAYVKIDELNGKLRVEILTAEERWNFFPTTKRCVVIHLVNLREITTAVTDSKWLGSIENIGPTLEELLLNQKAVSRL